MKNRNIFKKLSTFQLIILGFFGTILLGALLLMLPISSRAGEWTDFGSSLFTATSAVCVTGLIVHDTATHWSYFGQAIILLLIQIGGLGVITVAAFFAAISGRKISLMYRSVLQDSISAPQIGGVIRMTGFIFKAAFVLEFVGALMLMPTFCSKFGAEGIWMSFFHSISAFCNAGFDIMGGKSGEFTSLTAFSGDPAVVLPICFLIISGGIGFLTWEDIMKKKFKIREYRMQSKVILATSAIIIIIPMFIMFVMDFGDYPLKERLCLSFFQSVTPRTAGFNTADLTAMTSTGKLLIMVLMLIGGSPGSTAGGMKTTTVTVLMAETFSVFRRKKSAKLFGRRLEDGVGKSAAAILVMYLFLAVTAALIISGIENVAVDTCLFETASAIGTAGLSLGLTSTLGNVSRLILIGLMFFGRVGGLTVMYAAISSNGMEVSKYPVEKIAVG
ncbi:MAG: Trk family potassium uptake protein [Butyrivibrio sp.]|nr:Trk family potassium uptake protein [Butyrivibrio sp.]